MEVEGCGVHLVHLQSGTLPSAGSVHLAGGRVAQPHDFPSSLRDLPGEDAVVGERVAEYAHLVGTDQRFGRNGTVILGELLHPAAQLGALFAETLDRPLRNFARGPCQHGDIAVEVSFRLGLFETDALPRAVAGGLGERPGQGLHRIFGRVPGPARLVPAVAIVRSDLHAVFRRDFGSIGESVVPCGRSETHGTFDRPFETENDCRTVPLVGHLVKVAADALLRYVAVDPVPPCL